jgi:mannose/cellobiose epimerase-like protein (N-acyl-D-glucosamine 2-epimerase family)
MKARAPGARAERRAAPKPARTPAGGRLPYSADGALQFRRPTFLLDHVQRTLAFYDPRCVDPGGGFFHFYKDDGTVYDAHTRHLVSSTRFVFTQAMAYRRFQQAQYQERVRHGLAFLQQAHAQPQGGYAWQIDWRDGRATVQDGTNHCYGLAFVLLAHAHALMAGVHEAAAGLDATWQLMEQRFWEP